jgi:hypothetical protein
MSFVLAAWLAGREGIWRNWGGRIRVVVYLAAYTYGRLLFSATQDWLDARDASSASYPWPGANWDDYARPAIDLLTVLMLFWLLLPMFLLCRGLLTEKKSNPEGRPFSISFLFGWTAIAAVTLVWIRFLTWEGVAPHTAFSSASATALLVRTLTQRLPGRAVIAVAAMLMIIAWPRRWWVPLVALVATVLLDAYGHRALFWTVEYFTGQEAGSRVLTEPTLRRWSYFTGRNFIVWIAFGAAHWTGVSFRRARG